MRHLARLEEMQIRREQDNLTKEKTEIEKLLGSKARLNKFVRQELLSSAEKYGDKRKSPIVARKEAQAMKETEILPTEPITVVLSNHGWVRAAKGHEVDAASLSYRANDALKATAIGRSNQTAVFLDSTGRAYSLAAHTLPSARGQGEPLSGRLNPPPGATFIGVMLNEGDQHYVLASDAGYGFIVKLEELFGKNRAGKAALSTPKGAFALMPRQVSDIENEYLAVASNTGHLLIFPLKDLPQLSKGKGNKLMSIQSKKVATREEYVIDVAVLQANQLLQIVGDGKPFSMKPKDWQNYVGERARRGNLLPRGCRKLKGLQVADEGE